MCIVHNKFDKKSITCLKKIAMGKWYLLRKCKKNCKTSLNHLGAMTVFVALACFNALKISHDGMVSLKGHLRKGLKTKFFLVHS